MLCAPWGGRLSNATSLISRPAVLLEDCSQILGELLRDRNPEKGWVWRALLLGKNVLPYLEKGLVRDD